jgi:hypothetical protein
MKTATMVGMALIVLGVVAFAYQGITYTTREKVIDLGPPSHGRQKANHSASARGWGIGTRRRYCVADRWSQESLAR